MIFVDPDEIFKGVVLIMAPHMDDEVLACGGTIAQLQQPKERLHIIYATDGMGSPAPILPWLDSISPDLGVVRMREARDAMEYLGVPATNIHFLALPDGRLKNYKRALRDLLGELIEQLKPAHILIPFRYDCHTDHLALNRVITTAHRQGLFQAELTEYFVYYRWRLLPEGDIRKYIYPQYLIEVKTEGVSAQKRAALDCFKSQTMKFYSWQTRPNLSSLLLDEVARTPELFLRYHPSVPGPAIFSRSIPWIRVAHRLEPLMKRKKDQAIALWQRGVGRRYG